MDPICLYCGSKEVSLKDYKTLKCGLKVTRFKCKSCRKIFQDKYVYHKPGKDPLYYPTIITRHFKGRKREMKKILWDPNNLDPTIYTSRTTRIFRLTSTIMKILKNKKVNLHCHHCGKTLQIGDVVVSSLGKRYHKGCYEKLWIEV